VASKTAPALTVVGDAPVKTALSPPKSLGAIGCSLWSDIVAMYEFSDRASYETLALACGAADRADACRAQIDADGELIKVGTGWREHPLLKFELQNRSFVVRTLARLGLDLEPIRSGPGRPPGR
jgi:hypothetical protein